jgi:hypothetical protein
MYPAATCQLFMPYVELIVWIESVVYSTDNMCVRTLEGGGVVYERVPGDVGAGDGGAEGFVTMTVGVALATGIALGAMTESGIDAPRAALEIAGLAEAPPPLHAASAHIPSSGTYLMNVATCGGLEDGIRNSPATRVNYSVNRSGTHPEKSAEIEVRPGSRRGS